MPITIQAFIDSELAKILAADATADAKALAAALAADAVQDAAILAQAKADSDAVIAKLTADLAACRAGNSPPVDPPPPPPPPPPPTTGFPDATNTGVPAGTVLTPRSGVINVTVAGTVLDKLDLQGIIVVDAANVTVSNCRIRSGTNYNAVQCKPAASNFTMKDCDLIGGGTTNNGIAAKGTVLRCDISGFENGVSVMGALLLQDCFIHNMDGGPLAHFDSIEVNGGSNIKIIHNTVICEHDQTAALGMGTYFGNLNNVTADNNRLIGGGYTIYVGTDQGYIADDATIRITNNRLGRGHWGYAALYDNTNIVQSGNVDDVTGAPVRL